MYRDFSDASKQRLLGLVKEVEDEKWCDFTDWIGDRWLDFQGWIGHLNIKNHVDDVNTYHKKVIDKNNTTRSTIYAIFDEVKETDSLCASMIIGDRIVLEQITEYIRLLNRLVNPINGKFNTEIIFQEMEQFLSENDFYIPPVPPEYVMGNFEIIQGIDYTGDFLEGRCKWFDAIASAWDSNWLKNTLSLFGIGENLNESAVRKSIESLIRSTLVNKHKGTDFYNSYASALTPEEFKNFKKVVDYTVQQGKTFNDFELAELLGMDVREISEYDYLNFLRAQTDIEFFKSLSNGIEMTLGAYSDAVDAMDIASQMIGRLLNDYTEDLAYLESIRNAMIDGGYDQRIVDEVINKIEWNYKNQAASAVLIGFDKLSEEIANKAIKSLPDLFSSLKGAGALYSLFTASKDIGCIVSGLKGQTDNLEMIYATQQYSYALVEKYEIYANKIRSGMYTQEDIDNCNAYFNLARNAKIQEYEAMINLYESALKASGNSVVQNSDVSPIEWKAGLLNKGAYSFISEDDVQSAQYMIEQLKDEIDRLKMLDSSNATTSIGGMGGR